MIFEKTVSNTFIREHRDDALSPSLSPISINAIYDWRFPLIRPPEEMTS